MKKAPWFLRFLAPICESERDQFRVAARNAVAHADELSRACADMIEQHQRTLPVPIKEKRRA